MSLFPSHDKMYLIQWSVIKFVYKFLQVFGFLWILWFPLQKKPDHHCITEIDHDISLYKYMYFYLASCWGFILEILISCQLFYRKDIRKIGDAFMGYHDDTCAAIILHVCQEKGCDDQTIPQFEREVSIYL